MDFNVQLLLIVAVVVLVALLLGRRFVVKWGNKSGATGHRGEQVLRATGEGSSAERVTMRSEGEGLQDVTAKKGGKASDVEMDSRGGRTEADAAEEPADPA